MKSNPTKRAYTRIAPQSKLFKTEIVSHLSNPELKFFGEKHDGFVFAGLELAGVSTGLRMTTKSWEDFVSIVTKAGYQLEVI